MKKDYSYQLVKQFGSIKILGFSDDNPMSTPWPQVALDAENNILIGPDAGIEEFEEYQNGLFIAHRLPDAGDDLVIIDYHGNIIAEQLDELERVDDDYFTLKRKGKCNVMRSDGHMVLDKWYPRVGEYSNGYFMIGETQRKTKTTPTRRLVGLAHVSGTIVFPPVFDHGCLADAEDSLYHLYKDGTLYYSQHGSLYNPAKHEYPPLIEECMVARIARDCIKWTFGDIRFYYRDTDAPIDVENDYPIGRVLRAGFTIDASTLLERPAQKTRFLIAASHAARVGDRPDPEHVNAVEQKFNKMFSVASDLWPRSDIWGQAIFAPNTLFKVMDVYKKDDVTQVLLIQIPQTMARHMGDMPMNMPTGMGEAAEFDNIKDAARELLDRKMERGPHPRSLDREWVKSMSQPIGMRSYGTMYELEPDLSPTGDIETDVKMRVVHVMAEDADIPLQEDGVTWRGISASICDGCIFAKDVKSPAKGCPLAQGPEYMRRYMAQHCEDRVFQHLKKPKRGRKPRNPDA